MKVKTSELDGVALDWAVAKCEGFTEYDPVTEKMLPPRKEYGWVSLCDYNYSTDWSQAGPIVEREKIRLDPRDSEWQAATWYEATQNFKTSYGSTPLVAACRCFVASCLGDEVEVPDELA